jgi:hypothetical protein
MMLSAIRSAMARRRRNDDATLIAIAGLLALSFLA